MKKFEYRVVVIPVNMALTTNGYYKIAAEMEEKMNELGAEGWEFVQKNDGLYYFKREIE